jgi:hypothetical protein
LVNLYERKGKRLIKTKKNNKKEKKKKKKKGKRRKGKGDNKQTRREKVQNIPHWCKSPLKSLIN